MNTIKRTMNTMKVYPRGDFSFILDYPNYKGTGYGKGLDKQMFSDAFKAIESVKGGWEFMATDEPDEGGYMFGTSKNLRKRHEIDDAIGKLDTYHSGASYAITMRNMQYIAKNGWTAFIQLHWPEYNVSEPPS
jgi:hypothetical protein